MKELPALLFVIIMLCSCAPAERAAPPPTNPETTKMETIVHTHHTISYIEFTVTDMAVAKRFYASAFDWGFNDYGPDYAGIKRGDGESGGLRLDSTASTGGPLVILYSNDLETTLARVREAGGLIVKEPFTFPGGRRFEFQDPSGNGLAVWSES